MTAALEPARVSVDQLVSIHLDLNNQAGSVALSVTHTSCAIPTSNNWQALQGGFAVLPERSNDEAKGLAAGCASSSSQESVPTAGNIFDKDDGDSQNSGHNTATCSCPATPEQADTVGTALDDGKPSSCVPVVTPPQRRASDHYNIAGSRALTDAAEGVVGERFACYGATAGETNSRPVESPRMDPASMDDPGSAPTCVGSASGRGPDAGFTSSAPGLRGEASDEKEEAGPGPLSSPDGQAERASIGLSVHTQPAAGGPATATSGLASSNAEPVTPTTPPRQAHSAPLLPPPTDPQRMTLVLDLDGTLIASEDEPHAPVPFDYCVDEERFVWLRPGLRRFLDSVRPHFEVVLFTAAGESWATSALQRIDPDRTIFDSRLYRDHTVSSDDWPWVKDLSRLGRDLARVVIVDDNPLMFMYQPDNALHVAAYDPQLTAHNDDVLEQVLDVLMHKVLIAEDVREVLRNMKEPITASCMAARHAAAKAAATVHTAAARPGSGQGPQGRKNAGSTAAASPNARTVSDGHATQVPLGATPAGSPAKVSRRVRRLLKQQQQQQQQGPLVPQGLPVPPPPHGATSAEMDIAPTTSSGVPHQLQPEKRQRRPRSRRRGGGAGAGGDIGVGAAAGPGVGAATGPARAPASHLGAAAALAAAAQRPPIVVTRLRGPKHPLKNGAAQLAGPSPLQQPEQQLHLKLKLLQLQREQEAEEEEKGGRVQEGEKGREPHVPSALGAADLTRTWDGGPRAAPPAHTGLGREALPAAPGPPRPSDPAMRTAAASTANPTAASHEPALIDSCPSDVGQTAVAALAAKGATAPVQNVGELKARSRRRRRRAAAAAAAGQGDEPHAFHTLVAAKALAADAVSGTFLDCGNDLLAAAARRALQDRS
ncbi:hypothetical protein PLESTB_000387200 [Pleodorina starrii]|uniref:FCP1 homology domain-containing protein n=1 Tax=Pleodorina starrii TaxID=330485 RepID=A0A9W6BE67_9CHLO|nr:hypothetical protein PLESTM_000007700 [Pleodorina starrii]GLC50507.1 hypothetical protein PLESTB_000387200 [Pleodorina starrii]GLC73254.1 hypothetical protein PLESTF_001352500 [Pleodorina starrii]